MLLRNMLFEGDKSRRPQGCKGFTADQPTHPRIQQSHHVQLFEARPRLPRAGRPREEHLVPAVLEQLDARPMGLIPVHITRRIQPGLPARLSPSSVTAGYSLTDQTIKISH